VIPPESPKNKFVKLLREQKAEIFHSSLDRIEDKVLGDESSSTSTFHKESISVLYHLFLKYLSHQDNEVIRKYLISLHISGLGGQIAFAAWLVQRIFKESLFTNSTLAQFRKEILFTLDGLEDILFKFLAERIAEDERKLANLKKGNLIVLRISEALQQSKTLDDLLENFLDRILHIVKIDRINVYLVEKDIGLVLRASGECLPGRPLRILIHDSHLYRHVRHSGQRSPSFFLGMRIHIPLQDHDRMIGSMEIIFRSFPTISKEDLDLLKLIGLQLGGAIKNIQLQEEMILLNELVRMKEKDLTTLSITSTSLSKELYALSAIFTRIFQSIELDDMLTKCVDKILEIFSVDLVSIFLIDEEIQGLVLRVEKERGGGHLKGSKIIPLGEGIVGRVAQQGKPITERLSPNSSEWPRTQGFRNSQGVGMVSVPLNSKKALLGVLCLYWEGERVVTPNEIRLLSGLAALMGMALENIFLFQKAKAREKELAFFSEAAHLFSTTLDLESTMQKVARKATEVLGDSCLILMGDRRTGFTCQASYSCGDEGSCWSPIKEIHAPEMGEFFRKIVESGKTRLYKRISKAKNLPPFVAEWFRANSALSALVAPFPMKGEAIGLLISFTRLKTGFLGKHEIRLANTLAAIASVSLENSKLYAESIDREGILEEKVKERTKALEISEEGYRNLVENAKDIIFQIDPNNTFLFINKAVKDLAGFSPEELVGIHGKPLQLIQKEDREKVLREIVRVLKGEVLISKDLEYRHLCKDGRQIWVSQTTYPIKDSSGRIMGVEGVARDITEKKRLLKEIFDAKVLLEGIFEGITDGIVLLNNNFQLITCNKSAERFFNLPMNEMKGRNYLDLIRERTGCIQCLRPKKDLEHMHSGPHLWKDSDAKVVNLFWFPVMREKGASIQMINYLQDITVVAETQKELERSRRLALLGELSAGVAHQIRNPLGNITMGIKLLQNYFRKGTYPARGSSLSNKEVGSDEEVGLIFNDLSSGVNYLNRVVTNLLHYTKTLKPVVVEGDIGPIIEGVLFYFKETLAQKSIDVVKKVTPSLPPLPIDPSLMEQAMHNLIQNAIEAMSNHGTLTIVTRLGCEGSTMEILISDTGEGIPEKDIPKLFHPFFTCKENGVGLGLAIAQKIVGAHGGVISAESKVGNGSTFTIRLPLNRSS
jgi:PAS domain S-box-containing protein